MTREDAIKYLITNNYFVVEQLGTCAIEFYIKDLTKTECCSVLDIDRHVHLNTLFGYNIGLYNVIAIDNWLWESAKKNGNYKKIDVLDINYTDKELIQLAVAELKLPISFDDWIETDFYYYSYYFD